MTEWQPKLFECLSDPKLCVITWCCGICQLAHQKAVVEGTECNIVDVILIYCCGLCCAVKIRGAIREKYGIEGSLVSDILTVWCCGLCAVVQQHKQLIEKGDKPKGCFMDE
eukprot:NODE_2399_length_579_cov_64.902655_g2349_i0.p2 GENE.NODE_2399_length_579_cov_64.902655_g2349_i0~~NODE_2399_length_579_cov_64.902655_g2349_i0.p2  ORF type:complete len:111 (-),score=23.64 NODE_2399_length_579_cov_64.902655_g2349_i0:167-499(-)